MALKERWELFRRRRTPAPEIGPGEGAAAVPGRPHVGRLRILLAMALCLANAALSGLLLLQHHGDERASAAVSQVCGEGADSGCAVVARSRYPEVAGVPLAAIGIFFYGGLAALLLLALLAGPEARDAAGSLAFFALGAAVAVDLVLLGVQMVAIRAFCRLCLLTYAVNVLALVLLVGSRRDGAVVGQAVRRPDGRLVFAGWLMAALALGAAVLASEVGLSYREKDRMAAVLGPIPSAGPVGGSSRARQPGGAGQRGAALPGGGARGHGAGAPAAGDPRRPAEARAVLHGQGVARVRAGPHAASSTSRACP